MKKNSSKGYLILGILFILVSVIAFAVPAAKTAAFWISYGFAVIAFAAQLIIWKAALGRSESLKSKFLGFPVVHIGIVYLIVQVIALAVTYKKYLINKIKDDLNAKSNTAIQAFSSEGVTSGKF